MEKFRLVSMVDFVLEQRLKHAESFKSKVYAYANFLKQPLTLGMFVPCDEDGNLLEFPKYLGGSNEMLNQNNLYKYQQSKERVLFDIPNLDDLETIKKYIKSETIELLADGTVTLTQSALKKIGL